MKAVYLAADHLVVIGLSFVASGLACPVLGNSQRKLATVDTEGGGALTGVRLYRSCAGRLQELGVNGGSEVLGLAQDNRVFIRH